MALVDMKRTKAEKKAETGMLKSSPMDGEDYPYGLRVHLDHEGLNKLGIKQLPNVGDKLHLQAHAHVTEVSEEHRDGGKPRRRVHLELRKMSLANKPQEGHVEDGALTGAKAAMDAALDKREGGKEGSLKGKAGKLDAALDKEEQG